MKDIRPFPVRAWTRARLPLMLSALLFLPIGAPHPLLVNAAVDVPAGTDAESMDEFEPDQDVAGDAFAAENFAAGDEDGRGEFVDPGFEGEFEFDVVNGLDFVDAEAFGEDEEAPEFDEELTGEGAETDDEEAADEAELTEADDAEAEADADAPAGADAGGQAENAPKQAKPGVRNPVVDLIRRALGGRRPRGVPAGAKPESIKTPPSKRGRHPDSARAPIDNRTAGWMRNARAQIDEGDWKEALINLQKIAEQPDDTLFRTPNGKFVSLRFETQRLIGQAPAQLLEAYRVQFGGLAKQLLADAERTGDITAYGRIVSTYFHTPAGYQAANRLASLHLDRGEYALATQLFEALWRTAAPSTKDPVWRTKAAFASRLSGHASLSEEIAGEASAAGQERMTIGGTASTPAAWLKSLVPLQALSLEVLEEWPLFFGSPSRTGVTAGGEPLLLPRWNLPTTQSHPVRAQMEYLSEDLVDQGTQPLPLFFPISVQGKVVFRTLRGVQVVDATTGKPLWTTPESVPLELLLSAGVGASFNSSQNQRVMNWNVRFWNNRQQMQYAGGGGEYHPLANLLYRNANFGIVSSDGRQLFVLEDPTILSPRQPGQNWGWDGSANDGSSGGNKLTAYDLETGHPLWEIGGEAYGEPFDLPLAGHFFFGAPVVDNGDLFIVGEKEDQIYLFALDPATGRERWSQLIAISDAKIENDVGRRWFTAQVAISGGVIVCPTTVGWLIAVDRATRTLLWGQRMVPAAPANNGEMNENASMIQLTPLTGRWAPAPPVISGQYVLFTPPEDQHLYCCRLLDGSVAWKRSRENARYLAGAFDDRVVLVEQSRIRALNLETGKELWSTTVSAPSGRGVAVADRYYLPLAVGEVWAIDLRTGKVLTKSYLPEKSGSPGNLSMYRGMLMSVNSFGMTAFEQRGAIQAEIQQRKADNPRDPWANLREAEISALTRDFASTLTALRRIENEPVPEHLRERVRQLRIDSLDAVLRSNFLRPEAEVELRELSDLVQTAPERLQFRRLVAERYVAQQEFEKAFDAYLELATEGQDQLIHADNTGRLLVRTDLWLAGKLQDLWSMLPADQRATLDQRVMDLAERRLAAPRSEQLQMLRLFPQHRGTDTLRYAVVEAFAEEGQFLAAEQLLLPLQTSVDLPTAGRATERLARLMTQFGLPHDAAAIYSQLEQQFGTVVVSEGQTGAALVSALREAGTLPTAAAPAQVSAWVDGDLRMERMGSNYSNSHTQELARTGSQMPFFRDHHLQLQLPEERLDVIDARTDKVHWSLPLRNRAGTAEGTMAFAQSSNHHLLVLYRGILNALSPVDRRVLWSRPLENRVNTHNQYYSPNQNPIPPLYRSQNLRATRLAFQQNRQGNSVTIALANSEFVCYQGRRNLVALDAMTGDVRWIIDGIQPGSLVLGNEEVVYLRSADGRRVFAVRGLDGQQLEIPRLSELLTQALEIRGRNLLLAGPAQEKATEPTGADTPDTPDALDTSDAPEKDAAEQARSKPQQTLRLFDPLLQRDVWKRDLHEAALMSVLDNEQLAVLDPDGTFAWMSLATGEYKLLGKVPAEDLKNRGEVFALFDDQNAYLIVNSQASSNFYSEGIPFVRASGTIVAFDPVEAKLRWKQTLKGQNLILERIETSPLLMFAARRYEQRGKSRIWMLNLVAVDKSTGAKLLDETSPSQSGFRSLQYNMSDRYVELRSYSERIRLIPAKNAAQAAPAEAPPKS